MKTVTGLRRVVLYGRTSDDISEGRSVDDQLGELRRWADGTGRQVVAELRDDGISASRYAKGKVRPDWQAAMELITAGKTDELAVWEVSRGTRDRAVWAALIAACIDHRVDLAVNGKVHDPSDADDGFMLDLGAALAVRESAVISKRTQRAVDARAAAGRPHGSVPYGYRRVRDPLTGRAVAREIDPEHGPVVREIVQRLLAREPANAIANDLTRRGILTAEGKVWRGGNLSKLALRPTYVGARIYRGQVLKDVAGTWPALVTPAEHEQLLGLYADPGRDKFRNPTHAKWLGTGLYKCGREGCGGVMRIVKQSGHRQQSYACRTCHKVSRRQVLVDDQVVKLITARLSRPDVLELLAATGSDADVERAAEEVAELKRQLREARDRVTARKLTLDDYSHFKAVWEPQLAEAERRARPRWLPAAVFDVAGPDAAEKWKLQTPGAKRSILAALFEVTIMPAGRRGAPFDPNLIEVAWRGARS